jgi:hypothetical protein
MSSAASPFCWRLQPVFAAIDFHGVGTTQFGKKKITAKLYHSSVDAERLFSNFIGDEMLALASLPSSEQEENSEHLHTSSLKVPYFW